MTPTYSLFNRLIDFGQSVESEEMMGNTHKISTEEDRLADWLAQHPDAPIFRSLPRAGPVLAARFIAEMGDCRERLKEAGALQALAGTAPITIQSGSTRRVHFRFACNKPLRHQFQQFARQSARLDGSVWARGYVANQLERGHSNSRAYRALANRWASIIFRIWHDRILYDENYHLRSIAQRGLKTSPPSFSQAA
jgi:transposase